MASDWSNEIENFEKFLQIAGFDCVRREESAMFGNRVIEYRSATFGVRVVSDRGAWIVETADLVRQPTAWYDLGLVGGLFDQPWDTLPPLDKQIHFIQANWSVIAGAFDPSTSTQTHRQLATLGEERVKRLFPGLRRQTL